MFLRAWSGFSSFSQVSRTRRVLIPGWVCRSSRTSSLERSGELFFIQSSMRSKEIGELSESERSIEVSGLKLAIIVG